MAIGCTDVSDNIFFLSIHSVLINCICGIEKKPITNKNVITITK